MEDIKVYKTSEKLLIWMRRNSLTQEKVATELGITRQTLASRLKDNFFTSGDLVALKRIGFEI